MKHLLPSIIFGLLLVPTSAFAMRSQTFDFAAGEVNATWSGKGAIQMQQLPGGILLSTTGTGLFITESALTLSPQMGEITVSSETPAHLYLSWIYDKDPDQHQYNTALDLPAGEALTTYVSLSEVLSWSHSSKKIGLILLPHTQILLHQIRFDELNVLERTMEEWRSFWTFDWYENYSINFLWGPQLTNNPATRRDLFFIQPPSTSTSAMYVILWLLAILTAVLWFAAQRMITRKRALVIGSSLLLGIWIFLDLRMGSEFLSWILADQSSYIGVDSESRTFRERNRFYDFADFAAPLVRDRTSYIFFAEQQWPYLGNMRYLTYPSIPGIDLQHDDTWVIYRRSDVTVTKDNELNIDGLPVTGPGKILGRFDERSFVFRSNEPATMNISAPTQQ